MITGAITKNKELWLQTLYYNIGKQNTNFSICHTYKKDGEIKYSKWVNYLDADETTKQKANQRGQLKNEIIFDVDQGDYEGLIQQLKTDGVFFSAYKTKGNRARHIHTYWDGLASLEDSKRKEFRAFLLNKYNCDLMLSADTHLIAIENCEHWKTGEIKERYTQNEGINNIDRFMKEMHELQVTSKECKECKECKNNKYIDVAGGVLLDDSLVYEPIDFYRYLYKKGGKKGIATANKSPTNKYEWFIDIDGEIYLFNKKPIGKTIYLVPDDDSINEWIEGIYPEYTGEELKKELIGYFKITLDLTNPNHYYNPLAIVLQSWLKPALNSFFYIGFEGKFGGGKTIALEGMTPVSYHGYLVGDITQSGVARITDNGKLTLYVDELDVESGSKDNETYKIYRQGYRKGTPFVRLRERTYEPESFDISGTKGFTFAKDIEKALKQRTLITRMRKTKDARLPIVNMYIRDLGSKIGKKLFFYYMDHIDGILHSLPSLHSLPVTSTKELDIDKARESMYTELTKSFTKQDLDFLSRYYGRNTELAYNIVLISKAYNINLIAEMQDNFDEKEESDAIADDNHLLTILKEELIETYNDFKLKPGFRLDKGKNKGFFYYPKILIYEDFRKKLKDKELFTVGQDKFNELLKEINFLDTQNIQRQYCSDKNRVCLIFDDIILKSLDLNETKTEQVL